MRKNIRPENSPRYNRTILEHERLDEQDRILIEETGIPEDVEKALRLALECWRDGEEECGPDYVLCEVDWEWIRKQMGRPLTSWELAAIYREVPTDDKDIIMRGRFSRFDEEV